MNKKKKVRREIGFASQIEFIGRDEVACRAAILEFIKKKQLMVISTINREGNSQSAVVGFSETPELEIIFGTSCETRKYSNLQTNKNVSLVIGWDLEEKITVQYEGVVKEAVGEEIKICKSLHINKNPKREKHSNHPKERFFKIKPRWIRYSNLSKSPEEIFEIDFN